MMKFSLISLLFAIIPFSSAHAQSISPDGSILIENLTNAAGVWTFGAPYSPGNWWVNLNGQQIYRAGSEMVVANGGQLYALGTDNNWYLWHNGSWPGGASNPLMTPPTPPSAVSNSASITIFGSAVPKNPVEADFSAVTQG